MQSMLRIRSSLMAVVLSLAISTQSWAAGTPKDMFYQELKGADSGATSVAYCLELHRGDSAPTLCNNRYSFSSGDGIRLHVKTTTAAYAYIALMGSSGKKAVLYPPSADEDNRVEPGKEVLVPPKGMIVFDNNPGTEQLFVILSPNQLDLTRELDTSRAASIGGDEILSGLPVKVGSYQVMSNDGFYDLGEKAPGSGLVYVTNPEPAKPTVIALALSHGGGGDQGAAVNPAGSTQPGQNHPNNAAVAGNNGSIRTKYFVPALHNDGLPQLKDNDEVVAAFKKVPGLKKSGVDSGARDQYIAGLNHIYANFYDQQSLTPRGSMYYSQERQNPRTGDTGERLRTPNFTGTALPDERQPESSPGPTATFDGIAYIEECLSQGKSNLVGGKIMSDGWRDPKIYVVLDGKDLDAAWDANGGGPVVIGVDCRANMFGYKSDRFAGHVVVLSERRDMTQGSGRTSNHEYRLLNSWGLDNNGGVRNGWVSADAVASAMNYTDSAHDQSVEPHRALTKDALPQPSENDYARGDDGLQAELPPWQRDIQRPEWRSSINSSNFALDAAGDDRGLFGKKNKTDRAGDVAELRRHIADPKEGLSNEERSLTENSISELMSDKTDYGPRKIVLSNQQKLGILHEANRLFTESSKIYAQGLDQGDRNRALVGLLHDNANPEHINQGCHNTCNVTTIMKVETMLRPAAQAKRFVDMYTNANGDQTVNVP